MKRILIVVEGDTEKEFVNRILSPYLNARGLESVSCFKIKHTKGGLTKYHHIKIDLINCVFESNVVVSTLIDFYALPHDFPKYNEAKEIANKAERLSFLERAIIEDVELEKSREFPNLVPYIQLHEFEAFVFASYSGITSLFSPTDADLSAIDKIVNTYPNPEEINDHPDSAPSKRLEALIQGYHKVTDGIMIIEEIGIEAILSKCPRFRSWVETLIEKAKE